MKPEASQTVREIAIQHPHSAQVFESLGIDYCCGGKRSLTDACQQANIPVDHVLDLLSVTGSHPENTPANWTGAGIAALARHIVEQHHSYIRRESPRLISLLGKVVIRHAAAHPEVRSIQDLFGALADELHVHMMKEENVLFPHLAAMEAAADEGRPAPLAMFGSVETPIHRMLADHDDAGELLARIRDLSGNYSPPENACPTYRELYRSLEEFERDMHQHIHLENNILFPRALELQGNKAPHGRS
ncbi:MAG TPA: iron-sulfur cluster repair di-iron protein [Bryobacteraceae bacterium]|jgi:regulator of cell morphogenesis and NO signaling